MDLEFSEEQILFASTLERFLENEYGFEHRLAAVSAEGVLDLDMWMKLAELGCLALPVPEQAGGLGGTMVDAGLMLKALGGHLVVEPVQDVALVAGRLIARFATEEQQVSLLGPLMEGAGRAVLAGPENGQVDAEAWDGGWRLGGRLTLVAGAASADWLIVAASVPGAGRRLFIVPADAAGVEIAPVRLLDGSFGADVELVSVNLPEALADGEEAEQALQAAANEAAVGHCWSALGSMEAAFRQTSAYVKERQQFGRPLAAFQVVQHKVAEMAVCCEEASAVALLASLVLDRSPTGAEATRAVSAAKVRIAACARLVAREAVQLHGGMGVSEELPIASHFRKLLAFEAQAGTTRKHLDEYAATVVRARLHERSAVLLDDGR